MEKHQQNKDFSAGESWLVGTRIRDQRKQLGWSQARLAQKTGISPAYLSLIEQNKRRIGGALIQKIATELGRVAGDLTQGIDASTLAKLMAIVEDISGMAPSKSEMTDLIYQSPLGVDLLSKQADRIARLEADLAALNNKLTHDTKLSENLHEVISSVTVIRSTASILMDTTAENTAQHRRFSENIFEESKRLAATSTLLVETLQKEPSETGAPISGKLEFERFLAAHKYRVAELEADPDHSISTVVGDMSDKGRKFALPWLETYQRHLKILPNDMLNQAIKEHGLDVPKLAASLQVPPNVLFSRLATLMDGNERPIFGFGIVDTAGYWRFRKPILGFEFPNVGVPCAKWPIFQTFANPMQVRQAKIDVKTSPSVGMQAPKQMFKCYSVAQYLDPYQFEQSYGLQAYMLIQPSQEAEKTHAVQVGHTCELCPISECLARREAALSFV